MFATVGLWPIRLIAVQPSNAQFACDHKLQDDLTAVSEVECRAKRVRVGNTCEALRGNADARKGSRPAQIFDLGGREDHLSRDHEASKIRQL
ncbi:MAG: hypothetical protein WA989_03945 [Henriciella sp.]|uniref:hypothetical protein n=1 Tax=Henriciella sp. TaxID=1968823 RepID=UPI003C75BDBC